jgi:hypothetical protein
MGSLDDNSIALRTQMLRDEIRSGAGAPLPSNKPSFLGRSDGARKPGTAAGHYRG